MTRIMAGIGVVWLAAGAAQGAPWFEFGGGRTFPTGAFNEHYQGGMLLSAGLGWDVSPRVAVGVRYSRAAAPLDGESYRDPVYEQLYGPTRTDGGEVTVTGRCVELRYHPVTGGVAVWGSLGGGPCTTHADAITTYDPVYGTYRLGAPADKTVWRVFVGAGVAVAFAERTRLGVDVRTQSASADPVYGVPYGTASVSLVELRAFVRVRL